MWSRLLNTTVIPILSAILLVTGAEAQTNRLILVKVDGLSGIVLDAALDPDGPESERLPYPEQFREAHRLHRDIMDREILLPNLHAYFVRQGVLTKAMYSSTLTVSASAWSVIDSGRPSIVKNSFYMNRASGELQNFLDGLREVWGPMFQGSGRTTGVWQLDLLGVPLLQDAFETDRAWSALQIFVREPSGRQLAGIGTYLLKAGQREAGITEMARAQLSRFIHAPDIPEINDEALARLSRTLILEKDGDEERYDLLNLFFPTIDHQFHVDPNYRNILNWMIKIDDWFGEVMAAVAESNRKDRTIVALISDHGHDFNPITVNYVFPVTEWLRDAAFGGHTVRLPYAEDVLHAITVPVPGVDFSRVYESPASAYGRAVPHGEKGFHTAFAANYGNSRFDAYLRNSDLNELHLLLLDILRFRSDGRRLETIFPAFQDMLAAMRPWLERELQESRRAADALRRYGEMLSDPSRRGNDQDRDAVNRLSQEISGYRREASGLAALLAIPSEWDGWARWARRGFAVSDLIPKGYLGPANRLDRLMNYVVGWEDADEERWIAGPAAFRHVDYPQVIANFRATNPNAFGAHHPFHFFSAGIPVADLAGEWDRPIEQAIWLRPSGNLDDVLILESVDGEIRYLPIEPLAEVNGKYAALPRPGSDPLRCPAALDGDDDDLWLTPREWAERCGATDSSVLPIIVNDLFRPNYESLLESDAFRQRIADSALDADQHVHALRYRYRNGLPDFRVWMNPGWNANSREHIPGGSHGGFSPLETRTVFAVWTGEQIPIRRGAVIPDPYFTVDIVPTLFDLMGMLNEDRTVRTDSGVPFPPLPGKSIPLSD